MKDKNCLTCGLRHLLTALGSTVTLHKCALPVSVKVYQICCEDILHFNILFNIHSIALVYNFSPSLNSTIVHFPFHKNEYFMEIAKSHIHVIQTLKQKTSLNTKHSPVNMLTTVSVKFTAQIGICLLLQDNSGSGAVMLDHLLPQVIISVWFILDEPKYIKS